MENTTHSTNIAEIIVAIGLVFFTIMLFRIVEYLEKKRAVKRMQNKRKKVRARTEEKQALQ